MTTPRPGGTIGSGFFAMLDHETKMRIYAEAVNGKEPSLTTPDALEYRERIESEIQEIRDSGMDPEEHFHVPHEVP